MYGIVANVKSDSILRTGAKVWVLFCNGDASCPKVFGLSKHGKTIEKYTHYKRLTNFRSAWFPPNIIGREDWLWESRDDASYRAKSLNTMWSNIRYFNRDGTRLMQDGDPESAAFRKI